MGEREQKRIRLSLRERYGAAQVSSAMSQPPLVSICAVCYQHARYLENCLEHFLAQETDFPVEILVHDDASTDGSQDILRRYAARYPGLIFPLLQTENQYSQGITNISGAFNFPRARGKYLALSDCDDYWCDSGKLQKQVDYMEAHEDCMLCVHAACVVNENGEFVNAELMRPYTQNRVLSPEEIIDSRRGFPFASFLLRRSLVSELPGYYTQCPVGDRPLELMAAAAGKVCYMDEAMSVYRFNVEGSWTAQMKAGDYVDKQNRYAEQMGKCYELFDRASGGRYHALSVRAAERLYFLTRVNIRDWAEIYKPAYRGFLRELGLTTRLLMRLEYHFPGLYRRLQRRYHGRHA